MSASVNSIPGNLWIGAGSLPPPKPEQLCKDAMTIRKECEAGMPCPDAYHGWYMEMHGCCCLCGAVADWKRKPGDMRIPLTISELIRLVKTGLSPKALKDLERTLRERYRNGNVLEDIV